MRKKAMSILALLLLLTTLLPSTIIARANDNSSITSVPANWPVTFTPYTDANDNPIYDSAEEPGISPDDVDFTSGTDKGRGNLPSFYVASDNSNLFFRMRLKSDPRDRKGGFLSSVWLVHLGVNGELKATVGLDGKSPSGDFVYVANGDGTSVERIYDTDATGGNVPGARVVEAENGQYFLDFQVPIAKISELVQEISETTPLQFHFATSKAANLSVVNKDGQDDLPFSEGKVIQMNALPPSVDIDGGNSKTYDSTTGFILSGTTSIVSGQGSIDIDGTLGTFNISNNRWTFNLPTTISSTNGTYTASVTVTDSNRKTASDTQEINIETGNAGLITIDGGAKATTNSATPVISGTAGGQNGSKVNLFIDGTDVSGKINANGGTWETTGISLPSPSNGKEYKIEAKYTNSNGSVIYSSAIQKLTYQSDAATINLPTVSIGTITGDAIPTISGTSNNANQIELLIDNVTVGIVPPDNTGSWTVSLEKPLSIGNHEIKAIATNSYGSKAVASTTYTVNTTSISIENGLSVATNDNQPTIEGNTNASNGSAVTITFTNQDISQESYNVNAENGRWKLEYPLNKALNDGTYSVTAGVGGVSVTQQITIDTSTNVSLLSPDAQTSNTKPVISGTAEPNATVTLNIDKGNLVDTVFANDTGDWTYTPQNDLSEATHTVQANASDVNGNTKSVQKDFSIYIAPTQNPTIQVQKSVILEGAANDGSISETQVVTISNGTFAASLSKDDIKIDNLPYGLDYSVSKDSDSQITIGFTGNALSHTSADNVDNITVTVLSSGVLNGAIDLTSGSFAIHYSDPAPVGVTLDHLVVNKDDSDHQGDYILTTNQTYQTTVHGVFSDQSVRDVSLEASYTSSDSNVVSISSLGLVTAIAPGEATITINYGGQLFTQTITVPTTEPSFTLTLDANPTSIVGDGHSTGTVTATVLSKEPGHAPVSGVPVKFTIESGEPSEPVLTNAQGLATFTFTAPEINSIKPVTTFVTASANDLNTGTMAEEKIYITYIPPSIVGILINQITKEPIERAEITVTADFDNNGTADFTQTGFSDSEGRYKIVVPCGDCKYTLMVKAKVNNGINISTEQVVDLSNLDVSGQGDTIKPENKVTGQLFAKSTDGSSQALSYTDMFGNNNVKVNIDGNGYSNQVNIDSDGTFNFNDVPLGEYHISYQVMAPDGKTALAGPGATIKVDQEGEVSVVYDLIDPYGVVKDSNGAPLSDVHLNLYWADTALNIASGRTPGTLVNLPSIPDYPPNQNANPQVTTAAGEYGWMVPTDGDYYIIATKSGYLTYDSRVAKPNVAGSDSYITDGIIHIGSTIQSLDIQMEKSHVSGGQIPSYNPPAPQHLEANDLSVNTVNLEWDSVNGATSYNVFQDGRLIATGITDLKHTVIGLDPNTTYQFAVTAVNSGQESVKSESITVTTLAKAISGEHYLYIHGYEDGTFKPERNVTRAEVAAMLYNLYQLNNLDVKVKDFPDVPDNYWAKHVIDVVYSQGLMVGYTDGTFKPNDPITRAELATVIAKVKHLDIDTPNPFSDTQNNWARKSISIVAKLGIMIGYQDGSFKPNQNITRVETVIALNRMAQRGPLEKVNQSTWPDVKSNYWGFKDIEEASIDHRYIIDNNTEVKDQ
jgi:hypothetical protein